MKATSTEDCTCDWKLPPTMEYHLIQGNAPAIYFIYWPIASVSFIITSIIILPRLCQLRKAAIELRDLHDEIVSPFAYTVIRGIVAFPFFTVLGSLLILLSPVTAITFNFMVSVYSATVLYYFARFLIMLLGSFKSAHQAWETHAPKTKFYAAPPCCCLKICLKPKTMTRQDFRRIYFFIQQYMLVAPAIKFINLFPILFVNVNEHPKNNPVAGYIELFSTLLCVYGCQALLMVSKDILSEYNVKQKFRVIQASFMTLSIPSSIIKMIDIERQDEIYTEDVIRVALTSVVNCVVFMFLSFSYRHYFTEQTAYDAYCNVRKQKFRLPGTMLNVENDNRISDSYSDEKDIEKLDDTGEMNQLQQIHSTIESIDTKDEMKLQRSKTSNCNNVEHWNVCEKLSVRSNTC